jgi:hypothetical protein
MSQENVVLFTKAASESSALNERLAQSDSLTDWIRIADGEGFEFTADEFCAVIGETLHKKVTPQNAVQAYLAAGQEVEEGELSERMLDSVVGGKKPKHIIFQPVFLQHTPRYIIGT